MRTVDPESWYRTITNPAPGGRSWKFGRPAPAGLESRLRLSFRHVVKEWRQNASSACAKYVFDENKTLFEKVLLVLVLACGVAAGAWVLHGTTPPALVAAAPLPTARVPFPAVAFCSYNLISRTSLLLYLSTLMNEEDFNSTSVDTLARNAGQLASVVTLGRPTLDAEFLHLLRGIPRQNYNVTEILFALSPRCSELAWRCSWRGVAAACGGLLAPRITPHGYCCVFNGRYMPEDAKTPVKYLNVIGAERGLSVYLVENSDDFIYMRGLPDGIEVYVFESSQFPLAEAGSIRSFTAQRNSCAYCAVTANVQTMAQNGGVHFKSRGCRQYGAGSGWASRGHCLAECRRRAAAALCGCVPPAMLPAPADTVCTLTDVLCLNKHRGKFLYYWPVGAGGPELQEELTDSLDCDCGPECTRTEYRLRVYHSGDTFLHDYKFYRSAHSVGTSNDNVSVVKVYFDSESQPHYIVQPHPHFLLNLAFKSSVWYCVTSLNVATLLEVVFFLVVRLAVLTAQSRSPARSNR